MQSKYKILKYINKHPGCSYSDVAKKLFDGNIETASHKLIRNKDFLTGNGLYIEVNGHSIKTINGLSINSYGKDFLEERISQRNRFFIPLIVSVLALLISICSYLFPISCVL